MDTLRAAPPSTIITIHFVSRCIELVLQLQGFIISAIALIVFRRMRSIHINLIIVLNSFMISCLITSVIRLFILIRDISTSPEHLSHKMAIIWDTAWIGAVYTACHHPILLAFERLLAVIRSKTYEKERNVRLLLCLIFCTLTYSYFLALLPRITGAPSLLVCCLYLIASAISLGIIAYIRRSNLALWRRNRGVLDISHNYQVRENVETAMWLFPFMAIISAQILMAWISVMLFIYFLEVDQVPILAKVFGFLFDVFIGMLPTSTSFALYHYNIKINMVFKRWFTTCFRHHSDNTLQRSNRIIGLEGNQLKFDPKEEGTNYFHQYHMAWS